MSSEVVEMRSEEEWRRAWATSELRRLRLVVTKLHEVLERLDALLEQFARGESCKQG